MEISKNGRRQDLHAVVRKVAAGSGGALRRADEPDYDPRPAMIKAVYGDLEAAQGIFSSEMILSIGESYETALNKDLPSLSMLIYTYGRRPVEAMMLSMVTDTVVALGEESHCDAEDCRHVARALCASQNFRMLSMASVAQYFYRLQTGMIETEGWVRPAWLLRVANRFALTARAAEGRRYIQRERELERLLDDKTVSDDEFERWKLLHGITWSVQRHHALPPPAPDKT